MYCMTLVFWRFFNLPLSHQFWTVFMQFWRVLWVYGTSRGWWSESMLISLLTDMSGQPYSLKKKKRQNNTTDVSQRAISFSAALSCSPVKKENCIQWCQVRLNVYSLFELESSFGQTKKLHICMRQRIFFV